jgi:hypothetical protein
MSTSQPKEYDINQFLTSLPEPKSKVQEHDINEFLQNVTPTNKPQEIDLTKPYIGIRPVRSKQAIAQQKPIDYSKIVPEIANLADIPANLPGAVANLGTYLGSRLFGQSAEQASKTAENVSEPISNLPSKILGTEGYKSRLTDPINNYIASHINEGAEVIAKNLHIPVQDVQQGINALGLAAPFGAKYVAPLGSTVRGVASDIRGLRSDLTSQFEARKAPTIAPVTSVAPETTGLQSGGAAATVPETAVKAELANAHPTLQAQLANKPITSYTPQDLKSLEIHNKFSKVDPNFVPTEGQALQDITKMSDEYNHKALPGNELLREKFEQRNPMLIKGFNNIKEEFAPEHSGKSMEDKANNILEDIKINKVDKDTQAIKDAYKSLEDLGGGKFPIDSEAFAKNAMKKLTVETDDIDHLPEVWQKKLNRYLPQEKLDPKTGEVIGTTPPERDMNFNQFENLRTQLATASRASTDGNVRNALGHIRDALEDLPLKGENAEQKAVADQARSLFRAQKQLITPPTKNKPNPNYNKAYALAYDDPRTPEEIEKLIPHPDAKNFFKTLVTSDKASQSDINRLINLVGEGSKSHHELISGLVDHLKSNAGVVNTESGEVGAISQKALNKELNNLGGKLDLAVGSEAANRLRNIGDVARFTEHVRNAEGGNANVSQTAITSEREAAKKAIKEAALGVAEAGGNFATGGKLGLVTSITKPILRARNERLALEEQKRLQQEQLAKTISRTAGINNIKDIGK